MSIYHVGIICRDMFFTGLNVDNILFYDIFIFRWRLLKIMVLVFCKINCTKFTSCVTCVALGPIDEDS